MVEEARKKVIQILLTRSLFFGAENNKQFGCSKEKNKII